MTQRYKISGSAIDSTKLDAVRSETRISHFHRVFVQHLAYQRRPAGLDRDIPAPGAWPPLPLFSARSTVARGLGVRGRDIAGCRACNGCRPEKCEPLLGAAVTRNQYISLMREGALLLSCSTMRHARPLGARLLEIAFGEPPRAERRMYYDVALDPRALHGGPTGKTPNRG